MYGTYVVRYNIFLHTWRTYLQRGASFRVLTENGRRKLEDNSKVVSDFKQNKLEKEAQKNWDLFYKRNTTNFLKDRHWTTAEFKELLFDNCEVSIFDSHVWTNEWESEVI